MILNHSKAIRSVSYIPTVHFRYGIFRNLQLVIKYRDFD